MDDSPTSAGLTVIFMGNGPFAVPILDAVHSSRHDVRLVVTRPDRPQGKKREIVEGPVTEWARQRGLTVLQPETVNDAGIIEQFRGYSADLLVVADFGEILRPAALGSARLGGINIHGSLLPRYRGAAPVAWAIYHGERKSGVSVIHMTPVLDAGGVIRQESTEIGEDETAGELEARLAVLGASAAVQVLDDWQQGNVTPIPQDPALVTQAPRLRKEDGRIDWSRRADEIHNQIRAMNPWPLATADWRRDSGDAVRMQVLKSAVSSSAPNAEPGRVVSTDSGEIAVATGQGTLHILRLKPAGKREMDAGEFLRGSRMTMGAKFE